jgi:hypothetical protein
MQLLTFSPCVDRIAPVNAELRKRGLAEKRIKDLESLDVSNKKAVKTKAGLRCTSDLVCQHSRRNPTSTTFEKNSFKCIAST